MTTSDAIRIPGSELRDDDLVFIAQRWHVLTNISQEGDTFRADVEAGRMSGNARSMYDVRR